MTTNEYKRHVKALKDHALLMSIEGLQWSIKEDWTNPKWPAVLFDAMNEALAKKMGRKSYALWFDSLDEINTTTSVEGTV